MDSACNAIVKTLVNQLFARSIKPTRLECEGLARRLILKYPFVKDDLGNGYVSDCVEVICLSCDMIFLSVHVHKHHKMFFFHYL